MDIVSYLLGKNAGGGGGGGDTVDSHTLLLLHFDNDYKDSSKYNRIPARTMVTISYYGSGKFSPSFDLTTNSKGLIVYDSFADFIVNDFTIDFWVYPTNFGNSNSANGRPILGQYERNNWSAGWVIGICKYQGGNRKWGMHYTLSGGEHEFWLYSNDDLIQNTWQHLALTYKKSTRTICLYTNGIKQAEQTLEFDLTLPSGDYPQVFSVGNWFTTQYYQPLSYIDELRVSDVVRYDGNFIPPSKPY